jgi:hypothetical protein
MSLDYSIIVGLEAPYNQINIRNILTAGSNLGFIYREFKHCMGSLNDSPISVECAVNKVLQGTSDNLHSLLIEMDGTYAYIHFIQYPHSMTISLSGLCVMWSKKFYTGEEDLDIGRYAKALLDLVADYKIYSMNIEQD